MIAARQVIAFRMNRLGLGQRIRDVRGCADGVGLPDFPPGAAQAALAPRLERARPELLEEAFERRALVRVRAMRGAPVVVRAEDLDLFVSGVLPGDEASMRAFIGAAMSSVKAAKMTAVEAVELVTGEARRALARRALDRDALHAALRAALPAGLLPYCRPCDSHHVHPSLVYAAALRGRLVLFPRSDGPYLVARADRWLAAGKAAGGRRAGAESSSAPAELLRRFLRAYGPSTAPEFAAWAGIGGGQPRAIWKQVEEELAPVEVDLEVGAGSRRPARWILAADRDALAGASVPARQVRLLSPGDPLLQLRDRPLLVPDAALQKVIWKNLAPTGVLLVGSEVAGVVRAKKKKDRLEVVIEPVGKLAAPARGPAEEEAARLAAARGMDLALSWA